MARLDVLVPSEQVETGQAVPDASLKELLFFHASEGKPLATPWQVAMTRAEQIARLDLPSGWLLDCACGSGIQLAAYASRLKQPALGIELDHDRAVASCLNLNTIAHRYSTFDQGCIDDGDPFISSSCLQSDTRLFNGFMLLNHSIFASEGS